MKQSGMYARNSQMSMTTHSLHHEGTQCTRKYGNPKGAIMGKAVRKTEFQVKAERVANLPGPGHYVQPRMDVNRFRS